MVRLRLPQAWLLNGAGEGIRTLKRSATTSWATNPSILERRTGFEPATFSLGRRHSTAELPPREFYPRNMSLKIILY